METSQSLKSGLNQLISQEENGLDDKAIKTSLLKVINNTLIFGNTIYQIRNISVVEVAGLKKTYQIDKTIPKWKWFLLAFSLALGGVLLTYHGIGIFILVSLVFLVYQEINSDKTRTIEKYGLRIRMSCGEGVLLASDSEDFVKSVVIRLCKVMNSNEQESLVINFDTHQIDRIENRTINIGKSYGSTVISGQVVGDVVNNV